MGELPNQFPKATNQMPRTKSVTKSKSHAPNQLPNPKTTNQKPRTKSETKGHVPNQLPRFSRRITNPPEQAAFQHRPIVIHNKKCSIIITKNLSFENPCRQGVCTNTLPVVRRCARRNQSSRRVRAAKRAATFPPSTKASAAIAATLPSGTGVLRRDLHRNFVLLGRPLPPPREGISSAMYLRKRVRGGVTSSVRVKS